jgi:hypothetical protein
MLRQNDPRASPIRVLADDGQCRAAAADARKAGDLSDVDVDFMNVLAGLVARARVRQEVELEIERERALG